MYFETIEKSINRIVEYIINTKEEKIRKMHSNSLTPKWLELAEKSIIQSMVEPTSCMVEYHKDKNRLPSGYLSETNINKILNAMKNKRFYTARF